MKNYFNQFKNLIAASVFSISFLTLPIYSKENILKIGAIPDQNQEILDKRFNLLSKELSKKLKIKVKYVPVIDYTAAVSSFRTKKLDLVWFGGLSGTQARIQKPNSVIIAQRAIDKNFQSVFIANKKLNLKKIDDIDDLKLLRNLRFTFGSENSTSGRLMPQYFLNIAGVKIKDFKGGKVGFSGSHDTTIALVNSGAYDAGALNKQIWEKNLKLNNRTQNIDLFFITPKYSDYHWLAQGDLDKKFRKGFNKELQYIILNLNQNNPNDKKILDMFNAKRFIKADVNQYKNLEKIARDLKKIR